MSRALEMAERNILRMSTSPTSSAAVPATAVGAEAGAAPRGWPDPLDVPLLLTASLPRPGVGRLVLLLPALGLAGLGCALLLMPAAAGGLVWLSAIALSMLVIAAGSILAVGRVARLAREERQRVAEIDDLVAMRHWGPAAARLLALLGRPMRVGQTRLLCLLHMARVLMRFERFDDAVEVADAVLGDGQANPAIRFAVGCGRAMSLLRAGRLYDAGEAINQLRRDVNRLDDAVRRLARGVSEEPPGQEKPPQRPAPLDSVALTLVELYRDIQTRHSAEALAMLEAKRTALRDGLGVRVADALALGSVAAHRLGEAARASQLWSDATCLVSEAELRRRYPEVAEVTSVYGATAWPAPPVLPAGGAP